MFSFKGYLKARRARFFARAFAKHADQIVLSQHGTVDVELLEEGRWLKAKFDREIRVDRNTHLHSGDKHAHIFDRKGNELYAITQEGKLSHNSQPFKLTKDQAEALTGEGFKIPTDRIVEAILLRNGQTLLLE